MASFGGRCGLEQMEGEDFQNSGRSFGESILAWYGKRVTEFLVFLLVRSLKHRTTSLRHFQHWASLPVETDL